jgi:asparagine N-glycosylation enzyme membrane subunit Stt3
MVPALIAKIHNAWLTIPLGIRTAISFSVAVVVASAIALVQGYGWLVPTSLDAVKGEAIAFLSYAVPILAVLVAQLVRSQVAPAVVTWFLSTFGYAPIEASADEADAIRHAQKHCPTCKTWAKV